MRPTLLIADTDATQAYVFESNRLPEIRGASRLLDTLNREHSHAVIEQHGGSVIFTGGGGALALFKHQAEAEQAAAAIQTAYRTHSGSATTTTLTRSIPTDLNLQQEFGRFVSHVTRALRAHKFSKEAAPFVPALPFQQRCQSCRLRPADDVLTAQMPGEHSICAICYQKHAYGTRQQRGHWFQEFLTYVRTHVNQFQDSDAIAKAWLSEAALANVRYPLTVDEIANASLSGERLVGFIHLDGDKIGELFGKVNSAEQFTTFSTQLEDAANAAVFEALATQLTPRDTIASPLRTDLDADEPLTIFPFEIITIGGDDIWLMVPADVALSLASTIALHFADAVTPWVQAQLDPTHTVTMSAGVVLANDHTPIRLMRQTASQLIRHAKASGGALDFQVMHAPEALHRTVKETRDAYPLTLKKLEKGKDAGRDLKLVNRPMTHARLLTLWQDLASLKRDGFKTSQLQLLCDALLTGRRLSTLFYLYQSKRKPLAADYARLTALLKKQQSTTEHDPLPWAKLADDPAYSHVTTLWDVAELYPFVVA